jgi:hypothetical protein
VLMPWRIRSEADRKRVLAALPEFKGAVLLPSDQADETRREVAARLAGELDPARDIWVAAGRLEHPRSLYSLLHASVDPDQGATVDVLMALPGPATTSGTYTGYGELALLTLELERMHNAHLRIPLPVDAARAGLAAAGWRPSPSDPYLHEHAGEGG